MLVTMRCESMPRINPFTGLPQPRIQEKERIIERRTVRVGGGGVSSSTVAQTEFNTFWEDGDWDNFTEWPVTLVGTNTNTLTEETVATSGIHSNANNQYGRITVTGAETNDRRFYTRNGADSADSEIVSRWKTNDGQLGHAHRVQDDGTNVRAIVFWQNIVFGIKSNLLGSVWKSITGGTGSSLSLLGQGSIAGMANDYGTQTATRASNVVTVTLPLDHFVRGFDNLAISDADPDTTLDGDHTVTGSDPESATFNDTGSDGSSTVSVRNEKLFYQEYFVKSRVVGTKAMAKYWPPHETEPEWGHPYRSFAVDLSGVDLPTGSGANGILFGHFDNTSYDINHIKINTL